jgi:hypothetical protein
MDMIVVQLIAWGFSTRTGNRPLVAIGPRLAGLHLLTPTFNKSVVGFRVLGTPLAGKVHLKTLNPTSG